jgi:hypothetical protein
MMWSVRFDSVYYPNLREKSRRDVGSLNVTTFDKLAFRSDYLVLLP